MPLSSDEHRIPPHVYRRSYTRQTRTLWYPDTNDVLFLFCFALASTIFTCVSALTIKERVAADEETRELRLLELGVLVDYEREHRRTMADLSSSREESLVASHTAYQLQTEIEQTSQRVDTDLRKENFNAIAQQCLWAVTAIAWVIFVLAIT